MFAAACRVNALLRRNYSITGTQVSVEVYDDRVEITNPGSLLKGLTKKSLGKGISIQPFTDAMEKLGKKMRSGAWMKSLSR